MIDEQKEPVQKKRGQKTRDAASSAAAPVAAPAPEAQEPATATASSSSAAEALARAIEGARKPAEDTSSAAPSPEIPEVAPSAEAPSPEPVHAESAPAARSTIEAPSRIEARSGWRRHLPQAAAVALALGAGWAVGAQVSPPNSSADAGAPAWAQAVAAGVRESHDDVIRVTGDVRTVKVTVDALKDGLDKGKPDAGMRQVLERLDRSERLAQDVTARLAAVAGQLERTQAERTKLVASVSERLDRIERQIVATANTVASATPPASTSPAPAAPAPVAKAPIPEPTQTASLPAPDPRQTPVDGWLLLEVYDGLALIEGRSGEHEVAPGATVKGLGKIHAIEKRGKTWVVVTDKGFIGTQRR
jgi:hypothetical protein